MEIINYSNFRSNLADVLDRVNSDHAPIVVTRGKREPAVVMSMEDFRSYEETAYLMASPKNAQRLNAAIASLEAGQGISHDLIDE